VSRTPAPSPAGDAVNFLLSRGEHVHQDTRRIVIGLAVLGVLAIVVLNVGIFQSAQKRLVRDRWWQLATNADACRQDVRGVLDRLTREARYVVDRPVARIEIVDLASSPGAVRAAHVEQDLDRAREAFGFNSVRLYDAQGGALTSDGAGWHADDQLADLAVKAARAGGPLLLDSWQEPAGARALALALPVCSPPGHAVAVATFEVHADDVLQPALARHAGFGPSATAYVVRKVGSQVQFITAPPPGVKGAAEGPVPESAPQVRAAAMAVEGVESSISVADPSGTRKAVVTRFMPELGWGLVAQVDRAELGAGLRGMLYGLLAFDLALLALAIGALWLWRRQFKAGLAQREAEVTRHHAQRVQAVFDTAFDAIVTFDHTGHVRTLNRAAQALFDRTSAEVDGQPIHRFLQWGTSGRASTELPPTGTVLRAEALRADGSVLPVEFSLGSSGQGEDLLHTVIARDISERVEAECRIEAFARGLEVSNRRLEELNAQLEEASRLKTEFLANTSHELRTPLNGMIGFLQLVLDGMCDSPEEERDFQRQALECSRHLLGLINDVLDIAKIEAGKLNLEITPVDPGAVFDEVYTVTHVQAAQKGIRLAFEPPADHALRVRGDFGKVKQILINLVGNSLKFTPKGSITVRAVPHPDLGHCMFEVADTGIGIPPDRQKVIFEKFMQADGSTTRKYGGTGLGLAITRSLVELMGGIIGVQSEGQGKGTRMYFSLPVWNEEEEEGAAEEGTHEDRIEGPAGGQLVMVVEDDGVFRRFLSTVLQRNGYRTVEARNAEHGWVLARRLRPAVVVIDYALSCAENANLRTGWDLAERMTADAKTRHIPMLFVTGFEHELLGKLKSTAFARQPLHLMKPVESRDLLARIQELVGSIEGRVVRLLMADDDPAVGAYIRKVLPEERFHLEIATNGEECLHILRTQPHAFDLLLLDLMMPEVSGYDVLREMTLSGLAPDLPVLVLTNFPEPRDQDERRLLEQGLVLDVLPKTSVHENPQLLPHIIDWHLQVAREGPGGAPDLPPDGLEREAA